MIVDTNKCDQKPTEFDVVIEPGDVDLNERNVELTDRSEFTVRVSREDWLIRMNGQTSARFRRKCDRCFEALEGEEVIDFEGEFIVLEDLNPETEDTMKANGIDYSVFESSLVDLKEVFAEQLLVLCDTSFLCSPDCRGLCGDCGKKMTAQECSCGEEQIDPRWEALKKLKRG